MQYSRSNSYYPIFTGPFKVLIISITLWSFLFTSIIPPDIFVGKAWAADTQSGLTSVGSTGFGGPSAIKELNVDTFALPEYLGHIKDSWKTGSSIKNGQPIIIHIQDAHCNYTAQKKIADIIEYLNKEYGTAVINLEGGSRDYDLSMFTRIDNRVTREKVADNFVKEGLISGTEYFAINNPDKATLWGVEDISLYLENLNIYRESLKYKEVMGEELKILNHILSNLKQKIYSKELFEMDFKYVSYKEGNLTFKEYLTYLIYKAKEKNIDIKAFSNIFLLHQALEQEANIDFKKANSEREDLIDKLQKKLSKSAIEELVLKTLEFRTDKITQQEFYNYLIKNARFIGLSLDGFPELRKYIIYISTYNATDKTKTIEEIYSLEAKIKDSLCGNPEEKELAVLSKNLVILKNIFNITLTKDDYRYYKDNESSFDTRNFGNFINKYAPRYKITASLGANIGQIDEYRDNISKFYDCSLKRDEAFIRNIKFSANKTKPVVIVTGGFHTENLAHLFKENNISYISLMPNFKNEDNYECPYFRLLAGEVSGIQKRLYSVLTTNPTMSALAVESPLSALGYEGWRKAGLDMNAEVTLREVALEEGWIDEINEIVDLRLEGNNILFLMKDSAKNRTIPLDKFTKYYEPAIGQFLYVNRDAFDPRHETSKLLLAALNDYMKSNKPPTVLDMGCGNGVLGIFAVLNGARLVTATDIDMASVKCSQANVNEMKKRGAKFSGEISVKEGDLFENLDGRKFDLIMFNIPGWPDREIVTKRFFKELSGHLTANGEALIPWPEEIRMAPDEKPIVSIVDLLRMAKEYGLNISEMKKGIAYSIYSVTPVSKRASTTGTATVEINAPELIGLSENTLSEANNAMDRRSWDVAIAMYDSVIAQVAPIVTKPEQFGIKRQDGNMQKLLDILDSANSGKRTALSSKIVSMVKNMPLDTVPITDINGQEIEIRASTVINNPELFDLKEELGVTRIHMIGEIVKKLDTRFSTTGVDAGRSAYVGALAGAGKALEEVKTTDVDSLTLTSTIESAFKYKLTNSDSKSIEFEIQYNTSVLKDLNRIQKNDYYFRDSYTTTVQQLRNWINNDEAASVLLTYVLADIVSNAFEAIEQSGKEYGVINIKFNREPGLITLEVFDDGVGVPDELWNKLFTSVVTTKKEGVGRGLLFNGSSFLERNKDAKIEISTKDGQVISGYRYYYNSLGNISKIEQPWRELSATPFTTRVALILPANTQGAYMRASTTGSIISTNDLGQAVIDAKLGVVTKADNWGRANQRLETIGKSILSAAGQQMFNSEPAAINIAVSDEMSKQALESYFSQVTAVKSADNKLVAKYNLGNISINIFVDTPKGREELLTQMDSSNIPKTRAITFAYSTKDMPIDKNLQDRTYTVYMTGKEGQTATPVGACFMTGIALLNYFNLGNRAGNDEIRLVASGLGALTGADNIDELVKKIIEEGLLDPNKSGSILIAIRPVDTNEIAEFHKAEAQVMRSL